MTGRERIEKNPFFILGLGPESARAEVERTGQKLLGLLELKVGSAATYRTPLGDRPRSPELVREALAELRDPKKRLLWELWAGVGPVDPPQADPAPPWPDARRALGWGSL